jgi:hypothetical protein
MRKTAPISAVGSIIEASQDAKKQIADRMDGTQRAGREIRSNRFSERKTGLLSGSGRLT